MHFRRIALALAVVLLGVFITACDETTSGQRSQVVSLINSERSSRKIARLSQSAELNTKAGNWAAKMRDDCNISHSILTDGITFKWKSLGENVGYGKTIPEVHANLMASKRHKANMLNKAFNRVGVGVATGKCRGYQTVYVVEVFAQAI